MDPRERRRNTIKQIEEERRAKTAYDLIRIQLRRLQENVDVPVTIPKRQKTPSPPPPPEMVRNVVGSSAAAGSAEFHIYRNNKRKEENRWRHMEYKDKKLEKDREFKEKYKTLNEEAEAKRAKKRAKRLRRKEKLKSKKAKKNANQSESDDDSDADDSSEEGQGKASEAIGENSSVNSPGNEKPASHSDNQEVNNADEGEITANKRGRKNYRVKKADSDEEVEDET